MEKYGNATGNQRDRPLKKITIRLLKSDDQASKTSE
jgi:hypothetical protein